MPYKQIKRVMNTSRYEKSKDEYSFYPAERLPQARSYHTPTALYCATQGGRLLTRRSPDVQQGAAAPAGIS
jgi:hypothetical protein